MRVYRIIVDLAPEPGMQVPGKCKHWFSRRSAQRLVDSLTASGWTVRLQQSNPIAWEDTTL